MKREMEEEGEQWMAAWQGDDKDKYDERVVNIWIFKPPNAIPSNTTVTHWYDNKKTIQKSICYCYTTLKKLITFYLASLQKSRG